MDINQLVQNLSDAGCRGDVSEDIVRQYESGQIDGALHMMKKARCQALDELHESGRKVDCLDYLIRKTEKEMKQADF